MAGLPNSSNALQQWHHLFEAEGTKRSPQAQQHLQQLLRTGVCRWALRARTERCN